MPSTPFPTNVPATMSVNAAMTSRVNSQQNSMKSFRPVLPIYFSIIIPIDLPSFLTEAYSAQMCIRDRDGKDTVIRETGGKYGIFYSDVFM